jgi:hypothetical protein
MKDDKELRQTRATRLRRKIDQVLKGQPVHRPRSPREFTDAKAREAAEERRRKGTDDEAAPREDEASGDTS